MQKILKNPENKDESEKKGNYLGEEIQSTKNKETCTKEIQMLPRNNVNEDTSASQIESYEPQQGFMQRELLQSTSLINESMTLLHSQTKKLLVKDSPEIRTASDWDIAQARLNMETLAKLVQTKVNFIKVMKK